jgi:hypothetical protein
LPHFIGSGSGFQHDIINGDWLVFADSSFQFDLIGKAKWQKILA